MVTANMVSRIQKKYKAMVREMDERARRIWAASEALSLGYGGIMAVARATGLAVGTIRAGVRDVQRPGRKHAPHMRRNRKPGAGRKPIESDSAVPRALESLVEATTRGDPMSPLRWTCKSTRVLADELGREGHRISHASVGSILRGLGYSLQGNRKTSEGTSHPDRDAQFKYINERTRAFQEKGQPVISIDAKKKELVGDFKNAGREWRRKGDPVKVRTHDFEDKKLGKAVPYGVYDVTRNTGWVSIGIDHDTAEFAAASIREWWLQMGSAAYPRAKELLITADGGGSNGSRLRLWKVVLQRLADELRLRISVCHLPPGTSKWNKIEHRLFCHITKNWRGRPLESLDVIVNLVGQTSTKKGLRVRAALDARKYPKGLRVTDEQLSMLRIKRDTFHGDWNYTILPGRTATV